MAVVCQRAAALIGDACFITLLDEASQLLRPAGSAHADPDALSALREAMAAQALGVGEGMQGWVIQTGVALYLPTVDLAVIRPMLKPAHQRYVDRFGLTSVMVVAVRVQGRAIGTLHLSRDGGGEPYTPDDLQLLQELADRVALAVTSARLYADVEAALQAKDAALTLLDTLFASAPVGLAFLDTELRYQRINPLLAEINGLPVANHIGRTPAEVLPALAPAVMPLFRQVLATGEAMRNLELCGCTPAAPGALRHWLASYYPVAGPNGDPAGIGLVVAEITERKRAAEALRASEERFRTIIENSQDATVLTDAESRIHYCSAAITRILGYTAEELRGRLLRDLIDPEDARATDAAEGAHLLTAGSVGLLVVRARHKDGSWRWIQGRRSNQLANPAIGYVVSSIHDVTEQVQAEGELAHFIERMRALHAIDRAIIQTQSPAAIADAALHHLRTLIPVERASVLLYDRNLELGTVLAVSTAQPTQMRPGMQINLGWADWENDWEQMQPQIVEDVPTHLRTAQLDPHVLAEGWQSLLHVPLRARDQIIGTLNLWSSTAGVFHEAQREVVQEVADQLAIAIQHAQLFEEVSRAHDHLQVLSRRLVDTQEQERRHIARELHDEIGQMLTGLKLGLDLVAQQAPEPLVGILAPLRADVSALMERVRTLSLNLRPMMLDDLGLLPALQWHVSRYTAQTHIKVALRYNGLDRRFPAEVETAAYRVVQEALTNVARHARVANAHVRLLADDARLMLRVDDEGAGFVVEEALAAQATGGLSGMLERVRLLGGELTIESAPGVGTQVIAELPLHIRPAG
jgi:PAS domain S-box-containing protein